MSLRASLTEGRIGKSLLGYTNGLSIGRGTAAILCGHDRGSPIVNLFFSLSKIDRLDQEERSAWMVGAEVGSRIAEMRMQQQQQQPQRSDGSRRTVQKN